MTTNFNLTDFTGENWGATEITITSNLDFANWNGNGSSGMTLFTAPKSTFDQAYVENSLKWLKK